MQRLLPGESPTLPVTGGSELGFCFVVYALVDGMCYIPVCSSIDRSGFLYAAGVTNRDYLYLQGNEVHSSRGDDGEVIVPEGIYNNPA
jgi:hypothetical protein